MKDPSKSSAPPSRRPLLKPSSRVKFECRPGLPCFTACCQDVNIFLSSYDILRLKNRLQVTSGDFLERYTKTLLSPSGAIPLVQLKMQESDKRCPFVTPEGCTVYSDRPWACRMYPIDRTDAGGEYFFIAENEVCRGRNEPKEWAIEDWLTDQGVEPYEEMDDRFSIVTRNPRLMKEKLQDPRMQKMFWMAFYDLDTFRRFVYESRFLQTFEVEPEMVELARKDDMALLHLALRWLQFGLVCADVLPIREEVLKAKKAAQEEAGKKASDAE
ncbi:MAG: YkgJ family cysteine cluster protein [bacterium]